MPQAASHRRSLRVIKNIANKNDANRTALLVITAIVTVVCRSGRIGNNWPAPLDIDQGADHPDPNHLLVVQYSAYALHYAHMAYIKPGEGCTGLRFPGTADPVYWDFLYFAFTCGMAFATSDVEVTDRSIRKVVTFHCLAGFAFNIGVLAFTVNLLASGSS